MHTTPGTIPEGICLGGLVFEISGKISHGVPAANLESNLGKFLKKYAKIIKEIKAHRHIFQKFQEEKYFLSIFWNVPWRNIAELIWDFFAGILKRIIDFFFENSFNILCVSPKIVLGKIIENIWKNREKSWNLWKNSFRN